MPIFKSPAFIQQCFAVHPFSLSVKMVALPEKVGIYCDNCHMRHRLQVTMCQSQVGDESFTEIGAAESLGQCMADHAVDLRVSQVNVKSDSVQFRCRLCRRAYQLVVSLFETHQ
ncbi:MAG: hypothetical protein NPIRA02_37560 [Nitrospirales bacterium]|nr:MAG: hypothetical protein NPIRA02_37560 [Nitrospirales bacterium]